jgi:hypothetical protein
MSAEPTRDDAYCTALDQIKQIVAKYRRDVTALQGNAVISPRILTLLIERSGSQIPEGILARLRPLSKAVLNSSEIGIAELVGATVPGDLKSKIQLEAQSAYEALGVLYAEVMQCP